MYNRNGKERLKQYGYRSFKDYYHTAFKTIR